MIYPLKLGHEKEKKKDYETQYISSNIIMEYKKIKKWRKKIFDIIIFSRNDVKYFIFHF